MEYLNISYNQIKKLEGLVQLHGSQHNLRHLDIKGNDISDMNQLKYLTGLNVIEV
jgi:Leucine-rich repeat (LRR) protein